VETSEYQTAVRLLAKEQTDALLSGGQAARSKLEALITNYLGTLPAIQIATTAREYQLIERHVRHAEPTVAGLYLKLLHGRKTVDEPMDDWGADGPWIGPLKWFHCTYMTDIGIGFVDGEEIGPSRPIEYLPAPIHFRDGLMYFSGMYYGDWELQHVSSNPYCPGGTGETLVQPVGQVFT
jgi:hypothetical protein